MDEKDFIKCEYCGSLFYADNCVCDDNGNLFCPVCVEKINPFKSNVDFIVGLECQHKIDQLEKYKQDLKVILKPIIQASKMHYPNEFLTISDWRNMGKLIEELLK